MASTFQNRLVGTIILVAIAVIFLPELLDGEKQRTQDKFEAIPQRPPMKTLSQPEAFPHEEVSSAVTREVEIVDDVALDDETALEQPAPIEQQPAPAVVMPEIEPKQAEVNSGWVIQLGSFRHSKNVKDLLRKLEQAGYRAFSRPVQTGSGTLTKVFVGPDLQREKLEQAISHLEQVTGLKGQIAQFKVNS
ncbi:MAG: SPOR domain-containing protein [Alteromonadaceae bacterium]|nr:SPOR domain-containing protein [Alteromonadaceae bacterium]